MQNLNIFKRRRKSPLWISTQFPTTWRGRIKAKAKPQINDLWPYGPLMYQTSQSVHKLVSSSLSVGVISVQGVRIRGQITCEKKRKPKHTHTVHWDAAGTTMTTGERTGQGWILGLFSLWTQSELNLASRIHPANEESTSALSLQCQINQWSEI